MNDSTRTETIPERKAAAAGTTAEALPTGEGVEHAVLSGRMDLDEPGNISTEDGGSAGKVGVGAIGAGTETEKFSGGADDEEKVRSSAPAVFGKILKSALALISVFTLLYTAVYFVEKAEITPEKAASRVLSLFLGTDVEAESGSGTDSESAVESESENESAALQAPDERQPDELQPDETELKAPVQEYEILAFPLSLTNETPYTPDMDEILAEPRAIPPLEELYAEYGGDEPVVLILHTHGSESFSDTKDDGYRSPDRNKNVCALGDIICSILEEYGINTVHCDTLFDSPDFNMAYYNASLEIRRQTEEHPSIRYIIDVHRDSMTLPDGTDYAPAAAIDTGVAAQMMFVVGTDWGGSGHRSWRENLSLAARLQCLVNYDYPNVMRDINLRSASFNQQYAPGSLIVEIGTAASGIDECKTSAKIFAEALAREIIG